MDTSTYRWHAVQIAIFIVAMWLFLNIVPYLASAPIAEVPAEISAQMPNGCPSVFTNHTKYSCFWGGPLSEHKVKVGVMVSALLLLWGLFIFTALTRRGFPILKWARRRTRGDEPSGATRPNKSLERMRER